MLEKGARRVPADAKFMDKKKMVALVAHDNMKRDLAEWVDWNCAVLALHPLVCTGTTGKMVEKTLKNHSNETCNVDSLDITLLKSGPLGGDQQLGSLIVSGKVSALIFSAIRWRRSLTTSTSRPCCVSLRSTTCLRPSTAPRPIF